MLHLVANSFAVLSFVSLCIHRKKSLSDSTEAKQNQRNSIYIKSISRFIEEASALKPSLYVPNFREDSNYSAAHGMSFVFSAKSQTPVTTLSTELQSSIELSCGGVQKSADLLLKWESKRQLREALKNEKTEGFNLAEFIQRRFWKFGSKLNAFLNSLKQLSSDRSHNILACINCLLVKRFSENFAKPANMQRGNGRQTNST